MKVAALTLSVVALLAEADAGFIAPYAYFRSISLTLPGATFKKRNVQQLEGNVLEARGGKGDLYSACGTRNIASKFNKYPINGYGFASSSISFGANINNQPVLYSTVVSSSSAYDCCAQAMQNKNSTMFFYTSDPSAYTDPDTGATMNFNCQIVYNTANPIPNWEVLVLAASYNASAPRGTSYGNYIGNGNIGPGVRIAVNNAEVGSCAAASAGSGVNNGSGGDRSASSASASACSYIAPNVPDAGGDNPVGAGSSAGASAASSSSSSG